MNETIEEYLWKRLNEQRDRERDTPVPTNVYDSGTVLIAVISTVGFWVGLLSVIV